MRSRSRSRAIPSFFLDGFSHSQDTLFVACFFILVGLGLILLSSASAVVSFQKYGTSYYYIVHQFLFGFLPGFAALLLCSSTDYKKWKQWAFPLLIISIALLAAVFLPGIGMEYGGARRWIRLGAFSFQPSEIVKLTFVLYVAAWLSGKGEKNIKDFSYGFVPFITLVGIVSFLIVLQPDVGTMGVIIASVFTMYFLGGASISHVALAGVGGIGLMMILIKAAPYRMQRLTTFLNPDQDPLGIGYHINQALLAVGSGGLWGKGFGHSRQKFAYLPEVFGDSIFAVIAEELGFIFAVFFIAFILFWILRGLRIAQRMSDDFGMLVVVGIMSWIAFQTFINIGAMLSILPLTGIPLPFVSYGGTALIVEMAAIGIVINISRHMQTGSRQ
jgi:cell division protein FtsW